jgi:glutaredoxin
MARRIELLGKPGCHLCDDARTVVATVTGELGLPFVDVDITEDPKLHAQWADDIPVVLIDGQQHSFWRVDPDRLRAALR